jgi:hypothetical protein
VVKKVLQMILLPAVVMVAASGCSLDSVTVWPGGWQANRAPAPAGNAADKIRDNEQAVAALSKLGVPLERDALGRVRWIEAVHGELSDEAMRHLAGLPLLEWLEIGGGSETAAGMAHLKDCHALRRLYIHDVKLGDDALTCLSSLRRLEALSLRGTGITGKTLKHLNAAGTLRVLNLSGDEIRDEDMEQVARLTGLEVLALQNTKITGAGLARLEGMSRLNELNLANCRIVDGDLEHFAAMPNLRIVFAYDCDLSDEAIKDIGVTLPMLSIFR